MPVRLSALLFAGICLAATVRSEVIKPKVVVIALFEPGADTGDVPGELQFWVEREHLDRTIPLPAAFHSVRANADGSVVAILTGGGNVNAAASITALGCDPRFDLRESYWLVAGIAGIDPADGSLGSAAWADYVVDGDLAHEIDAREIPPDWPTGYVPLGRQRPYEQPPLVADYVTGQYYRLEPGLVRWAFELTRDTPLDDNEQMRQRRAAYTGFPNAQRPPFVLIGAEIAASTYWHGKLFDRWANEWVRYYTGGRANFVTTAMEDSGVLRALTNLGRAGKADAKRVLVLRTASNYDMQWPGGTAAESMNGEQLGIYTAYLPSLEAAYRVGSRVVHALASNWDRYRSALPQSIAAADSDPVELLFVGPNEAALQPLRDRLSGARPERHGAWTIWTGRLFGKPVALSCGESDPLNAVAATTLALRLHPPRLIVVYGTARPHDLALRSGDVVVSGAFAAFDGMISSPRGPGAGSEPDQWALLPHLLIADGEKEVPALQFPADAGAAAMALRLSNPGGRVISGVLGSAYQTNREADRTAWLRSKWHTSTEDGESAHVAGVAALFHVPVVGLSVVGGDPAAPAAFALQFAEAWK